MARGRTWAVCNAVSRMSLANPIGSSEAGMALLSRPNSGAGGCPSPGGHNVGKVAFHPRPSAKKVTN